MNDREIIQKTANWVKEKLLGENSGHDWEHAKAVWNNAIRIGAEESKVNMLIIELAALLHDVNDWKQDVLDDMKSAEMAEGWLRSLDVDKETIHEVLDIIRKVSFFGPNFVEEEMSNEGKVVRDADRLEAMGEVAWKRTLQFGAAKGIPEIHNYLPNLKLTDDQYKDYMRKENSSINHVFEKLLLLRERLETKTGKRVGQEKHEELKKVVADYLENLIESDSSKKELATTYLEMLTDSRFG